MINYTDRVCVLRLFCAACTLRTLSAVHSGIGESSKARTAFRVWSQLPERFQNTNRKSTSEHYLQGYRSEKVQVSKCKEKVLKVCDTS